MQTIRNYHWGRVIAGLIVIFGAGGLWETSPLATRYPDVTPWVTIGLAVVALFFNTDKGAK